LALSDFNEMASASDASLGKATPSLAKPSAGRNMPPLAGASSEAR